MTAAQALAAGSSACSSGSRRALALRPQRLERPRAAGPGQRPRRPRHALHSLAEIGRRHALRVAVVSLADHLYFGFCADPDLVDDLEWLAEGVEAEAAALIGLSGAD